MIHYIQLKHKMLQKGVLLSAFEWIAAPAWQTVSGGLWSKINSKKNA